MIAKVIVEGYLSGLNKSRKIGYGMEFSQYRGYEPGDDLRLLDWKMLARSGRYYIKQSDIDSNIAVKFVLDASNSMRHEEEGLSKIDYARILIASLAYLAQKQGDAIGFFAYNENSAHHLYPSLKKAHFDRFLHELLEVENSGIWKLDELESAKIHDRNHKEFIFFITDLYEYHDELSNFIRSLKTPKNEVIVIQIIGNKELRFDYKGLILFEDLETGEKYGPSGEVLSDEENNDDESEPDLTNMTDEEVRAYNAEKKLKQKAAASSCICLIYLLEWL